MLARPLELDLPALPARPAVTRRVTMDCAGNGRARLTPRALSRSSGDAPDQGQAFSAPPAPMGWSPTGTGSSPGAGAPSSTPAVAAMAALPRS